MNDVRNSPGIKLHAMDRSLASSQFSIVGSPRTARGCGGGGGGVAACHGSPRRGQATCHGSPQGGQGMCQASPQRSQCGGTPVIRVQPRLPAPPPPPPPPTLHAREWIECTGSSVYSEKNTSGDTACLWLAIVATVGNILVVAVVYACSFYEV